MRGVHVNSTTIDLDTIHCIMSLIFEILLMMNVLLAELFLTVDDE